MDIDGNEINQQNALGFQNTKTTSIRKVVKNPYAVTPSPKYNAKIRKSITNFERFPTGSRQNKKVEEKASVTNPYKKKTHFQVNNKKFDIQLQKNTQDESLIQYPHHAGRFRSDRQFHTCLTIEGSNVNEGINSYKPNSEKFDPQSDSTYLNDVNFGESFEQEDDDDDDELLSYVTFEKKNPQNM